MNVMQLLTLIIAIDSLMIIYLFFNEIKRNGSKMKIEENETQ